MRLIAIILISIILGGCSSMNIPPKLNSPTFTKKGDSEIEIGTSTNSIYQNIGYSLTNRFAIITSWHISYDHFDKNEYEKFRWSGVIFEYLPYPYEHRYIDLGLGYYKTIDHHSKSIYLGFGTGNANYKYKFSSDGNQQYEERGSFKNIFVQFNIGKDYEKIRYGLCTRLSYINYPFEFKTISFFPLNDDIKSNTTYNIFAFQPAFYLNYGKGRLSYTLNFGTYLTNYNEYSDWFIRDYPQNTLIHLSVGLKYKLNGTIE